VFNSIKGVYQQADSITLCYDKDYKTWSGNIFSIPDSFFEEIARLDTDNKISFYKDTFYIPNFTPIDLDTRQRQMLGKFMGEGGWHIQVDSDEYIFDFEKLTRFLRSNNFLLRKPNKTPVSFSAKWIMLFKQTPEGFYVIAPFNETFPFITNYPEYIHSRYTKCNNILLDFYVVHQSYARNSDEISTKLNNWGHKDDFDVETFFAKWSGLNQQNYSSFENFHPLTPNTWERLEFINSENINDFIAKCQKKFPQPMLKIKFTKKIKLFFKSLY
jgi:hypothetical protein